MNQTIKRHLISAGVTFTSAFLLVIATNLSADSIINWDGAAIVSLLITAIRAGLKGIIEILPTLIKEDEVRTGGKRK